MDKNAELMERLVALKWDHVLVIALYIEAFEAGRATLQSTLDRLAEPQGTFACPVCGEDTPHPHTEENIEHWLDAQAGRFGYRLESVLVKISNATWPLDKDTETIAAQEYVVNATRFDRLGLLAAFNAGVGWIREWAVSKVASANKEGSPE